LTGAVLVQRMSLKTPSRLVLGVSGDGPLSRVMAEVGEDGEIRGMVSDPRVEVPLAEPSELGVGRAIGNGILRVWREGTGLTYQSQVEVSRGGIGEALATFLAQSEQTRSAVLLGVLAGAEGISAAGGMMVEALPGGEDADLVSLESRLGDLESISRVLASRGLRGLIEDVVGTSRFTITESREIRYRCRCSVPDIRAHLCRLEPEARAGMRSSNGRLEAECVFCGTVYRFDEADTVDRVTVSETG